MRCGLERCAPALRGDPLTMYSRTRVPSLLPSFSSPAAWDSDGRRPEKGLLQRPMLGPGASHEDPSLVSSGPGRQMQEHMAGFTVIAPDQIRRDKITWIAEKELEDLEKWKQQQRSRTIHMKPNKLGGNQSEAEARKKQQYQLLQSKYQEKRKREEYIRIQKEVEEAKLQEIKAIQREKSNKLEEKRRLQEKQRREAFNDRPPYKSSELLSDLEPRVPTRSSRQTSYPDMQYAASQKLPALPKDHSLSKNRVLKNTFKEEENQKLQKMKDEQRKKGELLELKRQQQEEERTKALQREQRRVNNAFLDRIQGKSQPSGLHQFGGFGNMNYGKGWGV
ncbi:epithelial-stromal interaction protein 1 [Dromiciops gliroides]|uniref:epithelial-stromal interaction protein 1 n=1 Tax=Dromiciops gliroides TaxID=33562 RepID=UPI001CC3EB43|nr:epithelial-stromal interaction protein 1 [Dromiciops gliroides]